MQHITLGHQQIAYIDDRPEEDAAASGLLLWLHGGFVSHASWRPQREHFLSESAPPWRHIYVDLPGHGESSRDARSYDVEGFAQVMLDLLEALEVERAICVGHSLGGMIAQAMARQAPEHVAGLVLADTTYSTRSTLSESAQTLLAKALFSVLSVNRLAKMSAKQLGAIRPDVGPMIYREMMAHDGDRDHFLSMWRAVFDFDSRPWLSLIESPVLLLVAEENKATRAQRAGFVEALSDVEAVEIPRSGHMLGWDNPEAFNREVERFARRVLAMKR